LGRGRKSEKKEYEELLNRIFGVNVKWSKLSASELAQLVAVVTEPTFCYKVCTSQETVNKLIEQIRKAVEAIPYEGPLLRKLKKTLGIPTKGEQGGEEKGKADSHTRQ
jgi:hypothetical protein